MANAREVERHVLRLGETLDIATVQVFYADLKAAFYSGDPVILEGDKVLHIDTAYLQVLVAMFAYAAEYHRELVLHMPSQALVRTASQLGVSECIGLKVKANS